MVKKNYAAWHIKDKGFSDKLSDAEKLHYFAHYAILAPSGHNTQPWELSEKNGFLEVRVNQSRHLSIDGSGLLSVEPYVSIGTFIEVFELAAKGFGYRIDVKLFPENKIIARIRIGSKIPAKPSLLEAISTRVSNRNSFKKNSISKTTIDKITSTNISGISLTNLTSRSDIEFIAEQTEAAIKSIMGNPAYREELSIWVRANHSRKYEGMPGFTHGFGNIKSLLSKVAVRKGAKLGPQAKKSKELIRESGALVIVQCKDNKKESFVNAGRIYSQICVLANDSGIASSALGASVLDPVTRDNVKQHFNITNRPIYIIRLGKATIPSRHSPRWPLELVFNQSDA